MEVAALAVLSPGGPLVPFRLTRRSVGRRDVLLEVLYCGLCHHDLDSLRSADGQFPRVPGHEVVGRVVEAGRSVRRVKLGELAAIGWVSDACGTCEACQDGVAAGCELASEPKLGGYSTHVVAEERFVFRVPEGLVPAQVPPLLCAGSLLYALFADTPTMPGDRVAVVGTGAVAELAAKLTVALGAEATRVSPEQLSELSRDAAGAPLAGRFDVVVSAEVSRPGESSQDERAVAALARPEGVIFICDEPLMRPVLGISVKREGNQKGVRATACRMEHTEGVIDLCAAQGVRVEVEIVSFEDIDALHARLERDPGRWLVADPSTLPRR